MIIVGLGHWLVPSILEISRESRSEGLRHYHLIQTYPLSPPPSEVPVGENENNWPKFYFNKILDVLIYSDSSSDRQPHWWDFPLPRLDLLIRERQIHHLALTGRVLEQIRSSELEAWEKVLRTAAQSKNFLTITILCNWFYQEKGKDENEHSTVYSYGDSDVQVIPWPESMLHPTSNYNPPWLRDLERLSLLGQVPQPTFSRIDFWLAPIESQNLVAYW